MAGTWGVGTLQDCCGGQELPQSRNMNYRCGVASFFAALQIA